MNACEKRETSGQPRREGDFEIAEERLEAVDDDDGEAMHALPAPRALVQSRFV